MDFLGFEIRRFRGTLLTKPSKDALRRIRKRLSQEAMALRGANADAVITKLNPIIKGWAAYHRIGIQRAFAALDAHLWRLAYKWAKISHPNKPKRWIIARYFGMFNTARRDKWVFGSQETGFYLRKFAWTKIVRHRMVAGRASPDDPALTGYWTERRRRTRIPLDAAIWWLLRRQGGRCPLCRGLLLHADHEPQSPTEWQQWLTATRTAIRKQAIASAVDLRNPDEHAATRLIHAHCRRRLGDDTTQHLRTAWSLQGLLEPVAWKAGTAGSEGAGARYALRLPDKRWFAELQRRRLDRGVFCSLDELTTALQEWLEHWNANARPFTWTKNADQIIGAIGTQLAPHAARRPQPADPGHRAVTLVESLVHHAPTT